jgi:putative ABC transport system substrate-binding protein
VGLRDALVELGYREGEDFVLGVRFTQGDLAALAFAARQLVAFGTDLIIADSDDPTKAAQQATTEIPIVFLSVSDPLGLGTIESFAKPGKNVTGVTDMELKLGAKRLQVFHELIPGLRRVLFPYHATEAYALGMAAVYRDAARRLGIELIETPVRTQTEAQTMFAALRKEEIDGIITPWSPALNIIGLVMQTESQQGIPAMYGSTFFPQSGGLVSYGPDSFETGKLAARLVDKIMKGAKPADLPVEVNPEIEFVINLKTAATLGLTISPEMLYRADRLIR